MAGIYTERTVELSTDDRRLSEVERTDQQGFWMASPRPKRPMGSQPGNGRNALGTGHWSEKLAERPLPDWLNGGSATIVVIGDVESISSNRR